LKKTINQKKIILTDNLNSILENERLKNRIKSENQSRWNVVEEAWKNKLSPNLLEYVEGEFISVSSSFERVNLRSAINILFPYQKGKCFYCNKQMRTDALKEENDFPDVDHFLPFSFATRIELMGANINGVWNLVLACRECNRGDNGKFNAPADKVYFEKLLKRNLYFTEEHKHSLKNSVLISLGVKTSFELTSKMNLLYKNTEILVGWKPKSIYDE
jgi:CRISPR/Cas system Type II protein with McrA/HNH and RuvC-like nuclease domain